MLTPWGSAPWPSPFQAFIIIIINSLANGGGMSGAVTPGTGQLDPPPPNPPSTLLFMPCFWRDRAAQRELSTPFLGQTINLIRSIFN